MNKERLSKAIFEVVDIMARLRGPDGCPWDLKQDESTVKMYLLEEACEVLDAIEKDTPGDVCLELGDLFFIIIFLARLYEEKGLFNLIDVMEGVTAKMIRRHPHIFGDVKVSSSSEVTENWQKIKMEEKGGNSGASSLLEEVPSSLPSLLRAHRLSDKASKAGFDWNSKEDVWEKVEEEFSELEGSIENNSKEEVGEEIGDLFFSLVNLARHWGLNSERLLRDANNKFIRRFKDMEGELKKSGLSLEQASLKEMDEAWNNIKIKTG